MTESSRPQALPCSPLPKGEEWGEVAWFQIGAQCARVWRLAEMIARVQHPLYVFRQNVELEIQRVAGLCIF